MFFQKRVNLQICSKYTGKTRHRKLTNQLYWNQNSAWVLSCKFAAYLGKSCFYKHQWRTASVYFHSTCVPYFSRQIRVKFLLFCNIFLTSSVFYSERAVLLIPEFSLFLFKLVPCEPDFVTFYWIVYLQGGAWLNRYWNAAWTAM